MNGIPVARILGFEIRLPLSWVFIVALITVTVAGREPPLVPETEPVLAWVIGVVASLAFLVSVIAHELAHAILARRDGAETKELVVQFIGSPAAIDVIATSPRTEAMIALAGPAMSLALGLGAAAIAFVVLAAAPGLTAVADALLIVGALNLLLAGVSVVPAFPLDGARLVRAVGWARSGSARGGTKVAGAVGKLVGRLLLVAGFAVLLLNQDLTLDGIMIGLAGWFLIISSRSVDRWLILDELVQGMSVGEAMERDLSTISPQLTLDTFAAGVLDGSVIPALPVIQEDDVVGVVGIAQVRAVPRRNWPSTRTADVMVGKPDLPTATPDERLTVALDRLRRSHLDGLPVLDGGVLRGVLTRRSIAALLHARAEARGQAL